MMPNLDADKRGGLYHLVVDPIYFLRDNLGRTTPDSATSTKSHRIQGKPPKLSLASR